VAEKRHRLIHGEWWFNVFENGALNVRRVRSKKTKTKRVWFLEHIKVVSADELEDWANRLNAVADDFDELTPR